MARDRPPLVPGEGPPRPRGPALALSSSVALFRLNTWQLQLKGDHETCPEVRPRRQCGGGFVVVFPLLFELLENTAHPKSAADILHLRKCHHFPTICPCQYPGSHPWRPLWSPINSTYKVPFDVCPFITLYTQNILNQPPSSTIRNHATVSLLVSFIHSLTRPDLFSTLARAMILKHVSDCNSSTPPKKRWEPIM